MELKANLCKLYKSIKLQLPQIKKKLEFALQAKQVHAVAQNFVFMVHWQWWALELDKSS